MEGYDYYVRRDKAADARRGIALAPGLAHHATQNLTVDTDILKQRRKAREEAAAAKNGGKPNP